MISQTEVTIAIHKLLGPNNVKTVTFNRAQNDEHDRHDGIATIRCLNDVVYTKWNSRRAVPLLGKLVDFAPHHKSISGAAPLDQSRAHDKRPTREVVQDALTALHNEEPAGPTLSIIQETLQAGVDSIQERLLNIRSEINQHTTLSIDVVVAAQKTQHNLLLRQLQLLTTASTEYSKHMSGISSALLAAAPPEALLGPTQQPAPYYPPRIQHTPAAMISTITRIAIVYATLPIALVLCLHLYTTSALDAYTISTAITPHSLLPTLYSMHLHPDSTQRTYWLTRH